MKNILFVCLGNICRSSMAHGIMESELEKRGLSHINVDSAGTSNWHIGNPPDSRAIATAAQIGVDISNQHARQITPEDFNNFDLILAMDTDNFKDLQAMAPKNSTAELAMCLDFSSLNSGGNVPDPYYGGQEGFNLLIGMLEDACKGIADHITNQQN
ncbi:MAG TPA: low molecular weight phosphotyrosine protein phosphatase [Rhizobiales bacterium]|nr:low molecular weight phosphotyrosine protein phosphatase [Hyphomicrobiales bacterium]